MTALPEISYLLQEPTVQIGLDILFKSRPELGLLFGLLSSLLSSNKVTDIKITEVMSYLDKNVANYIRLLADSNTSEPAKEEIEIRMHENLKFLIALSDMQQ